MTTLKSVRLNKHDKTEIVRAMYIKSKQKKNIDSLSDKRHELAIAVRDFSLGKSKDIYLSLPKNLQATNGHISVADTPSKGWFAISFSSYEPCPRQNLRFSELAKSAQNKIVKFIELDKKYSRERDEFKSNVRALLESCGTTKKLEAAFVGIQQYYGGDLKYKLGSSNLPAIVNTDITLIQKSIIANNEAVSKK